MSKDLDAVNYLKVIDTVNRFAMHADHQEWSEVSQLLADAVLIDYDLDGFELERIPQGTLISSWKEQAHGFHSVQHLISNHGIEFSGNKRATCRTHALIHRTLPNNKGGSSWTLGGSYTFGLVLKMQGWKIQWIQWKTLWSAGNAALFELAFEKSHEAFASHPLTAENPNQ